MAGYVVPLADARKASMIRTGSAIPVAFTSLATILWLARQRWTAGVTVGVMLALYALFRLI